MMIKNRWLKLTSIALVSAMIFTIITPTFALASQSKESAASSSYVENTVVDLDQKVYIAGIKKDLFVLALKYGGVLFEEFLEYLGKKEYSDYVMKNRLLIADYLDSLEKVTENALVDFLIFECGIPQGAARVIANCIMFFIF